MRFWTQFVLAVVTAVASYAGEAKTYFPVSERGGPSTISTFEEEWYSSHLRLMKEPSLFAEQHTDGKEVYRFTFLPTWGDPRCAVVSREGDRAFIRFARLDGDGGYDPGKLVEQARRELKSEEIKEFAGLFDALKFSKLTTEDPVIGCDGSEWILECIKDGKYHVVVRWTANAYEPKKRGTESFVKLCEWMLSKAPRNIEAEQGGADQPATAPQSTPEGNEKAKPESEVRPQ